jgi:hypothetical protein
MGIRQGWDGMMEKGSERTSDPLRLLERAKRDGLEVGYHKNTSLVVVPWSRWKRLKWSHRMAFVLSQLHTSSSARQMAQHLPHVTNLIKRENNKRQRDHRVYKLTASYYDITHIEGGLEPPYHTQGTAPPSPITILQQYEHSIKRNPQLLKRYGLKVVDINRP